MAYKEKKDAFAYNNKFNKEAYDRINFTVPKGSRALIKSAAKQTGESVNGFIWRLVQAEFDRLGISIPGAEDQQEPTGEGYGVSLPEN